MDCSYIGIRPLPPLPRRQARTSGEYSWVCLDRLSPPPHIYRHPVGGPTTVRRGFEARAPGTAPYTRSTVYHQTKPQKFSADGSYVGLNDENWSHTTPLRHYEYGRIAKDAFNLRLQTSCDIKQYTQEFTQKPKILKIPTKQRSSREITEVVKITPKHVSWAERAEVVKIAPKQASAGGRRKRVTFKEELVETQTKHIPTILYHHRNSANVEESSPSSSDMDAYGNSDIPVMKKRNVRRSRKLGVTNQQRQVHRSSKTKPVKRKRHKGYPSASQRVRTQRRESNKCRPTTTHGTKKAPSNIKDSQIRRRFTCWEIFKFVLLLIASTIKSSILWLVRRLVNGYRFVKRNVKKLFERHYDIPKEWKGYLYSFQPWQTGISEQFAPYDPARFTFASC